ncbi:chromosomal replication initiator protein DnaA [Malacoplasma muris]|uniref:chromosomal replication initiator protein DnaA n=1 Tax=Malacoplasma muris TaxID=2119 RepID=UPI00398E4932
MNNITLKNSWEKLKIDIKSEFNNAFFYNSFLNTKFHKIINDKFYVITDSVFSKEVLTKDYLKIINHKLSLLTSKTYNVIFILDEEKNLLDKNIEIKNNIKNTLDDLDEKLIFENYIVGKFNKNLYEAANAIIDNNSLNINPLFIYGSTGLGKTHILNAIAFKYHNLYPNKKIKYISTEDFLRQAYSSISQGGLEIEEYKNSYNDIDLFLVDDIQFLTNKDKLNEIFFSIFNYLKKHNKTIIMTSDKSPETLKIDQRMISRFNSGLTIKIPSPDIDTIKEIIIDKINKSLRKNQFTSTSINFLANRFNTDIRILEGILNKILFYSINNMESDQIINEEIIKNILNLEIENGLLNNNYKINPNVIIDNISLAYGINPSLVTSKQRKKEIVFPRKVCMYVLREKLNMSYSEIGKYFSNRDHSTVIDSVNTISEKIKTDTQLKIFIENIIKRI